MADELLPSWRDGRSRRAILDFVVRVTQRDSNEFVDPEERIAVFDNDGTLWCEKPLPIQADFFMRKLGEMARLDPALREKQPWKAVVEHDHQWLSDVITKHYQGDDSNLKIMAGGLLKSYDGVTIEEFETEATAFLQTAQHPILKRLYPQCTYQPMIELLRFLKEVGFKNYIASGGGRDFMRPITQDLYEVPLDRVIGSSVALEYKDAGETAEIIHRAQADIFDDGPSKPVRIWSRIGRRPILAVGNSNGDIQMLRFCSLPSRPSLGILINHDDEKREFAYQAGAEDALKLSNFHNWMIVSMKNEWKTVFSDQIPQRKAA